MLTGGRGILRPSLLRGDSNCKGHFTLSGRKVRGPYGWWVENVFWHPQLRRNLNPSSVKGFTLGLSTVASTHGKDLCPKGILSLDYLDIVTMLLSLVLCLLGLNFSLLGFVSRLLGLVP